MIAFDPSEIAHWADAPTAPHQLPELIQRLVLATAPMPSLLNMPSGSSVWLPGWDGWPVGENAWVPPGALAFAKVAAILNRLAEIDPDDPVAGVQSRSEVCR